MPDHSSPLTSALDAASHGWPVFPLDPGHKTPAIRQWAQRATTDHARITGFWTRHPRHNVGIATGPAGLVVVDLDVAKPGQPVTAGFNMGARGRGSDALAALAERAGATVPDTRTVRTPSGGAHLYFRAPDGAALRNTAKRLGPLIDTRAHGGYVVAAGSTLPNGTYDLIADREPAILPAWIHRALSTRPSTTASERHHGPTVARSAYLDAIVRGECAKVSAAESGRHNKTLFQAALTLGQLVAGGELDAADAAAMLEQAAQHMVGGDCDCTPRQITATISSGLRLGGTRPRRLTPRAGRAA
ncbi:bifunctional DNA primase/polymerase [Saccharothrix hoggarensis]|uniref:Bifunctional DNA primase/polymerase n=1 Tax=Saccharothrix hoggarensis TaxID=913853 RepID=A0ABW3R2Y7_9PSEU